MGPPLICAQWLGPVRGRDSLRAASTAMACGVQSDLGVLRKHSYSGLAKHWGNLGLDW
jgi:hypothetical protein